MSSQQIDVDPSITLVTQNYSPPYAPSIVQLVQNGTTVMAVVVPRVLITENAVASVNLYRAPSPMGPWSLMDSRQLSDISVKNNLFDLDPRFGVESYYSASSFDTNNLESQKSTPVGISPSFTTS